MSQMIVLKSVVVPKMIAQIALTVLSALIVQYPLFAPDALPPPQPTDQQ